MRAGAVVFGDGVPIDTIMAAAVAGLRRDGIAVAGLLQRFGAGRAGCRREMWVEDVAGATCYRIDQDLGPGAVGCVLDEGGLGVAAAAPRAR